MASNSSIFGWENLWIEEPGGLQSTDLQRVRHNLVTKQQQQSKTQGEQIQKARQFLD